MLYALAGVVPACAQILYWTDDGAYTTNENFSGGEGTQANPWRIETAGDLARLAKLVNGGDKMVGKYFVQRGDIDLGGRRWEPIGKDATNTFLGNYDGMGHTISNMTIDETYTPAYPVSSGHAPGYGLFGSVNGVSSYASQSPVIQNIVLVDPIITIDCATHNKYTRVGLLVGALSNGSTLQNCNVQGGKITIANHKGLDKSAILFVGGAVGDCAPGFAGFDPSSVPITIKNISIDADITVQGTNTQGNYQYNAGGIVGRMRYSKGPLLNCYYTGTIDAPQFIVSPSYGAVRNNANSSTIASVMAGQFYDAAEREGEKVFFGDYKVKLGGEAHTITGDPVSGYSFTPAYMGQYTLTENTANGLKTWSFGGSCPTGTSSTEMYRAQGVNSCDTYVSDIDAEVEGKSLIDKFNDNVAAEMQHLFHWVNHSGKLHLHRKDDATMDSTTVETDHTLKVIFNDPDATGVTYHWAKTINGVDRDMDNDNATITIPEKSLVDVVWSAYVSYTIGGNEYHSNTVTYTQKKNVDVLPTISLAGSRTGNDLTLTSALNQQGLSLSNIAYHWTKGGDADSHTTASFSTEAFTAEDVDWEVYASYTFEGDVFQTEPAKYTQTVPQATVTATPNGEYIDIQINFDYGSEYTGITYNWDYNTYSLDAEGNEVATPHPHNSSSNTYQVSAVIFEERLWHTYVNYTYNSTEYVTPYVRYNQAPKPIPTLKVTKVENPSSDQLEMAATLDPNYSSITPTYHWSKNGEEQAGNEANRTVPHAFDTQLWRCWATFTIDGKDYRTNDETYTYYSTLGVLTFQATAEGSTVTAKFKDGTTFDSGVTVVISWEDSKGNHGDNDTYTNDKDAEWVEFKATITNDKGDKLVKYAHYSFDIERNVVYINYTGGGNDLNDGLSPNTPVATWAKAYSLLDDTGWDKNVIVIVKGSGNTIMSIKGTDTGGKAVTITGKWPWDGTPVNRDRDGRVNISATTGINGPRIGAPTRFKDVVFYSVVSSGQVRLSCFLNDIEFDTGVVMYNFDNLDKLSGLVEGHVAPHFHLQLYGDQLADDNFPQATDKVMQVTIRSGQFGRILASRIAGTKAKNTYIIGRHDNPLKANITVDIQDIENNRKANGTTYTDDIAYLAAGLTQGMMWGDITMNIKRGRITTLVGGSQGNGLNMGSLKVPVSTYCGRTVINVMAENNSDVVIENYYGCCQGRVYNTTDPYFCNAYFYGQSTLNMTGGTITSDIFASSAGISGLRSSDPKYYEKGWYTPDNCIPYEGTFAYGVDYLPYNRNKKLVTMRTHDGEIDLNDTEIKVNISNGIVNNVYGGSYGYSDPLPIAVAPAHAGRLFGNTSVNISGRTTTVNGNIYGGGKGSSDYFNSATSDARRRDFLDVAQVYGNTNVTITGNPTIRGNIYGGGAGIVSQPASGGKVASEFLDIAKVYGNTNVTIDADPTWEFRGNIYGGGAYGDVEGTTTVKILSGMLLGNVYGGGKGEDGHADKAKVTGGTKVLIGE